DHGIGKYLGLRTMRIGDKDADFLLLEYADGNQLYVPVDRLDLVSKYLGADSGAARLDRLGGASWQRVKESVRAALREMAEELLKLYARRSVAQVELLSRFRSPKEQKKIVEGLKNGTVDVVIGTHRLLGKDVEFKNLGLLIVDEEHRFGVAHKERVKQLRASVDVLAMTATPIPRTLYMSLSGVRDMSVIETPPVDRLPIETVVRRFIRAVIKGPLSRELQRGGQ